MRIDILSKTGGVGQSPAGRRLAPSPGPRTGYAFAQKGRHAVDWEGDEAPSGEREVDLNVDRHVTVEISAEESIGGGGVCVGGEGGGGTKERRDGSAFRQADEGADRPLEASHLPSRDDAQEEQERWRRSQQQQEEERTTWAPHGGVGEETSTTSTAQHNLDILQLVLEAIPMSSVSSPPSGLLPRRGRHIDIDTQTQTQIQRYTDTESLLPGFGSRLHSPRTPRDKAHQEVTSSPAESLLPRASTPLDSPRSPRRGMGIELGSVVASSHGGPGVRGDLGRKRSQSPHTPRDNAKEVRF